MTAQLDAFSSLIDASYPPRPAVPYQPRSETSRDAADKIAPHVGNHERDVLQAIVASGERGISRKELSEIIGWADRQMNRVTGRVASLMQRRLVGEKHEIQYDRHGDPGYSTVRRDGSAVLIARPGARAALEGVEV